ncbi:hypothetical protein CN187_23765 [Sinorhizobium meliloti]|uniref:hypothetical protein n=1 Tax=Rhizobium meliloti TaxID=382 RepID=UPI000FDA7B0A|nr:hypothetical protein [Sinorhizobium meliloti]RVI63892.1 hypothetical protein CN187_23765 [Sinorhizobium meliloti]
MSKTEITLPLSFTDAAKALREVIGLLSEVGRAVGAISNAVEGRKGKQAAESLDVLAFKSDGTRRHLEKIAAGEGRFEDFDAIREKMEETAADVEASIDRLNALRAFLRERHGMGLANRVSDLVYAGGGKASIRMDLRHLAFMQHDHYSSKEVALEARRILYNINALNESLVSLHDEILRISNAPG